jgi:hypothetical protein
MGLGIDAALVHGDLVETCPRILGWSLDNLSGGRAVGLGPV